MHPIVTTVVEFKLHFPFYPNIFYLLNTFQRVFPFYSGIETKTWMIDTRFILKDT